MNNNDEISKNTAEIRHETELIVKKRNFNSRIHEEEMIKGAECDEVYIYVYIYFYAYITYIYTDIRICIYTSYTYIYMYIHINIGNIWASR
jgi:hypothetical protein